MSKKILFVDDETNVLRSLKRTFIDSDFETVFANSANEALQILEQQGVDMVISDIRMPAMDGYALLRVVREKYPQISRVVLSGYTEKKTLLKAVTDGTAQIYLTKPWQNEKLISDINSLFDSMECTKEEGVLNIIHSVNNLPVLPAACSEILDLLRSDASVNTITERIEMEPDLAARTLRIINSAFYGISIGSVKQAIIYLGFDTIKNVVLSAEAFEVFNNLPEAKLQVQLLWSHSNVCNSILHGLHQQLFLEKVPESFGAAGLLHDIGRLVILKYSPEAFLSICRKSHESTAVCSEELEREAIGTDHMHLGGYLMQWWNLPVDIVDTCLYHHGPFDKGLRNPEIHALIHLADVYSWKYISPSHYARIEPGALSMLKIQEEEVEKMIIKIMESRNKTTEHDGDQSD